EGGPAVRKPITNTDGTRPLVSFVTLHVERVLRGSAPSTVYMTTGSPPTEFAPGERYLVYASRYADDDPSMFMTVPSYGTKLLSHARDDLEFLDVLSNGTSGATITGVLELDESDASQPESSVMSLPNMTIRLTLWNDSVDVMTGADGRFRTSALRTGRWTA